ncbi:MAG TPA: YceI family protein [Candidatus Limnocylindrales bacterium]|nr:YceI family protein [Candidatus Limnocylindrales bacterium]
MKRFRWLASSSLVFSALLLAAQALAAPQPYEIDPVHSRVEFTIRHMFSKVSGNFGTFHGTVNYDASAPAASSVAAEIDASSIDTNNDKRDGHLKSPDFFDVAKFPTLSFTSTKITPVADGKFKVEGNLTMHGVTKPVVMDAAFLGAGPGLDGVVRAGFEGMTKVDRKDYGIVWNKALDQGSTLLGDEVAINLMIEAVAPKAGADTKDQKKDLKKVEKTEKKETEKAGK